MGISERRLVRYNAGSFGDDLCKSSIFEVGSKVLLESEPDSSGDEGGTGEGDRRAGGTGGKPAGLWRTGLERRRSPALPKASSLDIGIRDADGRPWCGCRRCSTAPTSRWMRASTPSASDRLRRLTRRRIGRCR